MTENLKENINEKEGKKQEKKEIIKILELIK